MNTPSKVPNVPILREFFNVTKDVPQVPFGAVSVGVVALDSMDWSDFGNRQLTRQEAQALCDATGDVHRAVSVAKVPSLRAMHFAWELVRSVLVSSTSMIAASDGSGGVKLDEITPVRPDELAVSAEFLSRTASRSFMRDVFVTATGTLYRSDIVREIDVYEATIKQVAAEFVGAPPTDPDRMARMDGACRGLSEYIRPELARAFWNDADMARQAAEVAAHNFTRWEPSPALVAAHFGPPPAS